MTVIATDTQRLSNLVKREFWSENGWCRKAITVNEAAVKTYAVGTVLGKVTADGKYKISVETAVDGSETAAAIVMGDYSIAAATDTTVLCYVRGPLIVADGALVLDATYDDATKVAAAHAALEALDIMIETQI